MSEDKELKGIRHRWGRRALSTGRIATSALRLAGRQLTGRGDSGGALGEKLARELDGMKGLAMKVGQILSYFDGVLPEETHQALRKLQQGARPVAFDTMRPVLEEALGGEVGELFQDFNPDAVAAASIGQVYRASLSGVPVAVKVQYPNVEKTFESDFGRIRKLARLASLATAVDGLAIADELRERISAECDYEQEARWQSWFQKELAHLEKVRVPSVVPERSAASVLTSEWYEGLGFYEFVDTASQEERNQAGLTLAQVAWFCFFQLGTINADPHPGNYIFLENGEIVLLDFGCVRSFEPEYIDRERTLTRIVIEGRRAEFEEAVNRTGMVAKPRKFDYDAHWEMLRHSLTPYCTDHFRFTFEYIREGSQFTGPGNPNLRKLAIPPAWIWQQRLQWGLHAVLARLGAEGDFRATLRLGVMAEQ